MIPKSITWRPGIGDPDFIGWLTTLLYALSVVLSFRAGLRASKEAAEKRLARPWYFIGILLVFLGLNKQLDLQTLMIQIGRELAQREGWFQERRRVQLVFTGLLGGGMLAAILVLGPTAKGFLRRHKPAAAGLALLALFVFLRAANIDHADERLGLEGRGARRVFVLELSGLMCVIFSAGRAGSPLCAREEK